MTRLTSRLAWTLALALLAGCVGSRSIGTGQPCPCAPGWICNTTTNTCVASSKACDDYFAATYLRCGGPRLPPDETARIRARFEQVCATQSALPGSGVTSATLEACASALNESPCEFPAGPPQACDFKGSLPGGTACTDSLQCQSGLCEGQFSFNPGGESDSRMCGTCQAAANIGGNCNAGGCSTGACITQDTTASMPTYTCTAIVQGDVGAPCDDLTALCQTGLYCAAQTGTCTPLGTIGTPCGDGSPGDPGGCLAPLGCVGSPGAAICSSGAPGASCSRDLDCSPGVGCSVSGQCVSITWANPGEACGDAIRCLVGTCNLVGGVVVGGTHVSLDGGPLTGTCPMVVPDGQPCSGGTCDTFSECFAGTCGLFDSAVCR